MRRRSTKPTFAGGELAPDLEGRVDISRYDTSVQKASNFYVTRFGSMSNRPGLEYIGNTKPNSNTDDYSVRLMPFEFSVDQTYALEWTSRDIEWIDSFQSSTINANLWTKSAFETELSAGAGALRFAVLGEPLGRTASLSAKSTFPKFSETSYSMSGRITSNMPVGAVSGFTNNFYIRFQIGGKNITFGFSNGAAAGYSAPNYRGHYIQRTGLSDVIIDSDDFTDITWGITASGTTATLTFNGVEYPVTTSSSTMTAFSINCQCIGAAAPELTASVYGIEDGITSALISRPSDNVMRVIKDGGIVLTSRRSSTYRWSPSGSGTSEYYCELVAGGNPSIPGATEVWENGSAMTEGTLGSLAAGEWAYGDNDSLDYGTIYVRLTDSADPDSKAVDYVQSDYQLDTGIYNYSLQAMTYAQSADTMFLASADFAPKKLVRTADDVWTLSTISFSPAAATPIDTSYTTNMVTGDRQILYRFARLDTDGVESLPTDELVVAGNLQWAATERVDLFINSIRDTTFQWTVSGSGTAEYYCELSGGGDPSLNEPSQVFADRAEMTLGTIGSLAAGEYAYGDNDTLGYDTFYVRLADDTDPDTKTVGWITYLESTDVQFRVYKNYRGDWGWLGDIDKPFFLDDNIEPDVSVAPKEDRGVFASADNYPQAVGIFEQRLCYARTNSQPQTVWTSTTGDLTNFTISRPLSSEDSIEVTMYSGGRVDEIRHLIPIDKLLVLTTGSEWTFDSGPNNDALTPFSVYFRNQGATGCSSSVAPLPIHNEAMFVQRDGKDIRSMRFRLEDESYLGEIMSYFVPHLFEDRTILSWCYQQHPQNLVWIVMSDGDMLTMTYIPEQQMVAFTRHETEGQVLSCASLTTQGEDVVYMAIKRRINGNSRYFIERLASRNFGRNVRNGKFLDSMLSYDSPTTITNVVVTATEVTVTASGHGMSTGDYCLIDDVVGITSTEAHDDYPAFNDRYYKVANATTNAFELEDLDGNALTSTEFSGTYERGGVVYECTKSVSGLDHLEGSTVSVLADGNALGTFTVSGGAITLGTENPGYGVVHVGLPYTCDLQTLRLEPNNGSASIQGLRQRVVQVKTRFRDSSGGKLGPDEDTLTLIKWRQDEDWQQPNALKTGDVDHVMKSTWNDDGRFLFRQDSPLPTTISAFIIDYENGEK